MADLSPLPNWIYDKLYFAGGVRQKKAKRWYEAQEGVSRGGSCSPSFIFRGDARKGDSVTMGELRYWCGLPGTTNLCYASCRCCREVIRFAAERKEHKRQGCGSSLERAYKRLAKTKDCIICNLATKRRLYGLPLCCKDCEQEFMYSNIQPDPLRAQLKEIAKEDEERKEKK
jgi:hypothetical protein